MCIPLENHTANPWLILATRTLANPARSFANLMVFKIRLDARDAAGNLWR